MLCYYFSFELVDDAVDGQLIANECGDTEQQ
jgi:hypothetical protein